MKRLVFLILALMCYSTAYSEDELKTRVTKWRKYGYLWCKEMVPYAEKIPLEILEQDPEEGSSAVYVECQRMLFVRGNENYWSDNMLLLRKMVEIYVGAKTDRLRYIIANSMFDLFHPDDLSLHAAELRPALKRDIRENNSSKFYALYILGRLKGATKEDVLQGIERMDAEDPLKVDAVRARFDDKAAENRLIQRATGCEHIDLNPKVITLSDALSYVGTERVKQFLINNFKSTEIAVYDSRESFPKYYVYSVCLVHLLRYERIFPIKTGRYLCPTPEDLDLLEDYCSKTYKIDYSKKTNWLPRKK